MAEIRRVFQPYRVELVTNMATPAPVISRASTNVSMLVATPIMQLLAAITSSPLISSFFLPYLSDALDAGMFPTRVNHQNGTYDMGEVIFKRVNIDSVFLITPSHHLETTSPTCLNRTTERTVFVAFEHN